jgi:heme oxygenase
MQEQYLSLTDAGKMAMIKAGAVICLAAMCLQSTWAQEQAPPKRVVERVKRPRFSQRDWDAVYFEDLFTQALVGERPATLGQARAPLASPSAASHANSDPGDQNISGAWSQLVSSQAIEDEIKKTHLELDSLVTTPQKFKTDNALIRRDLSLLSTMFAIVAEYDDTVRWKDEAETARDAFAQAAANAQTSSPEAFASASARRDMLAEMIRGEKLSQGTGATSAQMDWTHWADRVVLMNRLNTSFESRLKPWTSNPTEFSSHVDDILHEANIAAAIGHALVQDGLDDADDDNYRQFAAQMSQAARDIQAAVQENNYDAASSGVNRLGQACSNCHETYQ